MTRGTAAEVRASERPERRLDPRDDGDAFARRRHDRLLHDDRRFIDALRWLQTAQADSILTDLIVNPSRPDRLEPRVIKRRMTEYTLMKKPRQKLHKSLSRKKTAA